ncbi:MAG: hypothetical protein ACYSWW_28890, partial [Planctomycetota bacterium]
MGNHEGKSRNWAVRVAAVIGCFGVVCSGPSAARVAEGRLADIPVKEVTIFKDGHVLVLHEGQVGTDDAGNVVLDYLPTPILGTFWAYSAESKAKLAGVVSGRRVVSIDRTA